MSIHVPASLLPEGSLGALLEKAVPTQRSAPTRSETPKATVEVPHLPPIVAATDGSCRGNPGPGGWSWYIDSEHWASGGDVHTTNNVMELMAVREVLAATKDRPEPLTLKIDSKYVIQVLTEWIHNWRRNGWKTKAGKDVANRALIEEISTLMRGRDVRFDWVKGHAGNALNEAADSRACAAADHARSGSAARFGPGY